MNLREVLKHASVLRNASQALKALQTVNGLTREQAVEAVEIFEALTTVPAVDDEAGVDAPIAVIESAREPVTSANGSTGRRSDTRGAADERLD